MSLEEEVRDLIDDTLSLGGRLAGMNAKGRLLGSVPELDSVGVVAILTALEERFGLTVNDDEITADTFATLGSLVEYVDQKLNA